MTNEADWTNFLATYSRAPSASSRAPSAYRGIVNQVGGFLKGAAKAALPLPVRPLGGFGGPLGAQIGRGAASAAGGILGLEAELNGEDHGFEGAKTFVRMAADAVKTAATAPPDVDPRHPRNGGDGRRRKTRARTSGKREKSHRHHGAGSGRWVRRGRNVIVLNCG